MRRSLFLLSILLLAFSAVAENVKTFDVTYTATIAKVPSGLTELDVWIPLPASRGWQHVSNVMIDADGSMDPAEIPSFIDALPTTGAGKVLRRLLKDQ